MRTRIMHSYETKMEVIEMKLKGYTDKYIQKELGIKNRTQVWTWWSWYQKGEIHRFNQPVGKQYTYGKGPEGSTPEENPQTSKQIVKAAGRTLKKVYQERKEVVPEVIVELVEEYRGIIAIQEILRLFDIPKSTYYRWKKLPKKGHYDYTETEKLIIGLCKQHKYRYGYRKITALIRRERSINKNTVQRIMQKFECQCRVKIKRNYKHQHQAVVMDNVLDRNFKANRPLEKLVTDITYLPYGNKMMYLSSIMDLYSKEIIAYTIGDTQDLEFVIDTLNQLPNMTLPCVLHSDQGSVYTSKEYQQRVKNKSITMSMSRKGTPADNAPIESFHASLKCETFEIQPELKSSTEIVSQSVLDYIKYYNQFRIQEKLGYLSPLEFMKIHFT